ncbi:C2H2-like zinc finger protein [Melia azedarach]|uniref:C2H2-like zinc finger protein n=1 Tax=Melia azedarach TaxID=155640 RepID=A0ACC1YK48_MELAZ|nr:C2H2-like zinc finger protein [Melia azedarach]
MQINQSKSNEKMKENNETQSEYFEGDHKCFVCNVTFATGNALGGHMSSHAKKRKMEVMRNGGLSIFRSEEEEPPQQGPDENGSNQPPDESVASTDEPPKSNEEIEGNV